MNSTEIALKSIDWDYTEELENGDLIKHASFEFWSYDWCEIALKNRWFESSDFHNAGQILHDKDVLLGKAYGDYAGDSAFKNLWEIGLGLTDEEELGIIQKPREFFEIWVLTNNKQNEFKGIIILERFPLEVEEISEPTKSKNDIAKYSFPTLILGDIGFFVPKKHRKNGYASLLAKQMLYDYQPILKNMYKDSPFLPFIVAHDRGLKLLKNISPWPLLKTCVDCPNRRQDMYKAVVDSFENNREWYPGLKKIDKDLENSRKCKT